MHDYVTGLTNQIAARLPVQPDQTGSRDDPVLEQLLEKLIYTLSPDMIPTLIEIICEPDRIANVDFFTCDGLVNYAPHSEETRKTIVEAAGHSDGNIKQELKYLLDCYDSNNEETKLGRTTAKSGSTNANAGVAPTAPIQTHAAAEISNPQFPISDAASAAAPARVAKSPETILAEMRDNLPEDWTCQLLLNPGEMKGSRGLVTNPLFRMDFTNLNILINDGSR